MRLQGSTDMGAGILLPAVVGRRTGQHQQVLLAVGVRHGELDMIAIADVHNCAAAGRNLSRGECNDFVACHGNLRCCVADPIYCSNGQR